MSQYEKFKANESEIKLALKDAITSALKSFEEDGGNLKDLDWFNVKVYK